MIKIILLSGPIGGGKTSVSNFLIKKYEYVQIKTGDFLKNILIKQGNELSRRALQDLGDHFDDQTNFRWVVDFANSNFDAQPNKKYWIFDAVRKERQIIHFREKYGELIFHAHVTAPEEILIERYSHRSWSREEDVRPYFEVVSHSNEIESRSLIVHADKVFDSNSSSAEEVAESIHSFVSSGRKA